MKPLLKLFAIGLVVGLAANSSAAELTRAQFTKAEMDIMGYPTNAALAKELGRSDARRDLSNGVMRVHSFGLPLPSSGEYGRILKQKYNIEVTGLGGCIVSGGLVAYADGYASVSRTVIEQKFGTNIWDQTRAEAEKAFRGKTFIEEFPPDTRTYYPIRPGDTLTTIARKHNVTLKALSDANPDVNPTKLKVGHRLVIPTPGKL